MQRFSVYIPRVAYMGNLLIHVRKVFWIHYTVYYCGFDDTLNIEQQFLSSVLSMINNYVQNQGVKEFFA